MDRRQRADLDNHITGHYGEDQFKGEKEFDNFDDWYEELVLHCNAMEIEVPEKRRCEIDFENGLAPWESAEGGN